MTGEPLSFFTLDHGTASTSAALIGRFGGRFRLLASGAVPAGVAEEPLLEDLVARVVAADPSGLDGASAWPDWARLSVATGEPPRVVCAAGTERRLADLERAFADAGWDVAGRIGAGPLDPLAASEACLDRSVAAVAVAAGDPVSGEERGALQVVATLIGAAVARRPELVCLLAGGASEFASTLPAERVLVAPAPVAAAAGVRSPLRDAADALALRVTDDERRADRPDARAPYRTSIASLAALLDRTVEAVDVGHSAGAHLLAAPDGIRRDVVRADGALVPIAALSDDRPLDAILRWSPLRGDLLAQRDRLRMLRIAPWRDSSTDGARLRMAAARAALARLEAAMDAREGSGPAIVPDLLVASGGVFSVAPPAASALAVLDTLRRPGALGLFHDHARLLAPVGTLPDEADRRRLLADLLDDALLPLGSALLATDLRAGRQAGTLRLTAPSGVREIELVPGTVQLVDLPPGVSATAELETREGAWLGVRSRHVALPVAGGLAGLLLDTRDAPLRLPERAERRREVLDAIESPLWASDDGGVRVGEERA